MYIVVHNFTKKIKLNSLDKTHTKMSISFSGIIQTEPPPREREGNLQHG